MLDGTPNADSAPSETASEQVSQEAVTETTETPIEPTDPGLLPEGEAPEQPPEAETAEVPDDLEEIDYGGEKYKVPKKLKDGFLMQADYTRKTQEVAEQRKAIEAQQAALKQSEEATRAHAREIGRVLSLNDELAELDKTDWAKLNQDDPFEAQTRFQRRMLLKDEREGLIAQIQTREQQRSQEAQQEFAKRYAETNERLSKDITGWNQELADKLRDFAKANGATDDDIRSFAVNAPIVKLLHKAFMGEQLITAKQAQAKTSEPKVIAKPLPKVTGSGARPSVNLAEADMETYVAERRKQGFGKR